MRYHNIIYKIMLLPLFQRILFILFLLRALAAFINCFLPFDMPHAIRQTDTLAVAIRYWSRWAYEPSIGHDFIPAVLNSGTSYGFMPTEFPFITVITAPFFYFGPYWGKVFACLFIWLTVLTLSLINLKIWKNISICGLNAFSAVLLFPIFSFSASLAWRFMPDFISVQFCLLAIGLTWQRNQFIKPFFLALIGLLLKPVTIIIFPLYLLHQNIWQKKYNLVWIIPSILISFLYYTKGISYLDTFRKIPSNFGVHKDIGFSSIIDFFSHFYEFLDFLNYHPLFPYGLIITLMLFFYYSFKKKEIQYFKIWFVIILQIFILAALDGSHSFVHFYYWFGVAPSFCLIALGAWKMLGENSNYVTNGMKLLLALLFVIRFFEVIYLDTRGIRSEKRMSSIIPYADCLNLKKRNPEFPWNKGYVFQSENTEAPFLGVCFGERTNVPVKLFNNDKNLNACIVRSELGDNYKYGFFSINHLVPLNCKIADSSGKVALVTCNAE